MPPWWESRCRRAARSAWLRALSGGRIDRHEIVVVKVHAPRSELAQLLHRQHRIERRPHEVAERIASAVSHGPEPKRELVGGSGLECVHAIQSVFPWRHRLDAQHNNMLK